MAMMDPAETVTVLGLVAALAIFSYSALNIWIRSGRVPWGNLKFQLAIATLVWLFGESLSVVGFAYPTTDTPLAIHSVSMALFAAFVVLRIPRVLAPSRKNRTER